MNPIITLRCDATGRPLSFFGGTGQVAPEIINVYQIESTGELQASQGVRLLLGRTINAEATAACIAAKVSAADLLIKSTGPAEYVDAVEVCRVYPTSNNPFGYIVANAEVTEHFLSEYQRSRERPPSSFHESATVLDIAIQALLVHCPSQLFEIHPGIRSRQPFRAYGPNRTYGWGYSSGSETSGRPMHEVPAQVWRLPVGQPNAAPGPLTPVPADAQIKVPGWALNYLLEMAGTPQGHLLYDDGVTTHVGSSNKNPTKS